MLAQTIILLPLLGIFFDSHFSFTCCVPALMSGGGFSFYDHWKQVEVPRMQILRQNSMEEVY